MQHLLFQNIINYFIIISMREFRKITTDLYLQIPYSKNGSIINLYKFCVHSYDLLKEKLFCQYIILQAFHNSPNSTTVVCYSLLWKLWERERKQFSLLKSGEQWLKKFFSHLASNGLFSRCAQLLVLTQVTVNCSIHKCLKLCLLHG